MSTDTSCAANRLRAAFTVENFKQWLARPQVWGFFVSIAVMAVVSIMFFAPNNLAGDTLSQADQVQGAANGAEAQAYEQATGEKTLWTNSLFGGMPTFQISPSYESNSLFTWLNEVYGLGLPTPSNLLFMMMFGFLIMCYCWKMRWYYGLLGALTWGFSSYFIIIIGAGHIWKFVALAYMPPVIGAMALAYRGRWLSGAALLALFATLELNANHPQITYYAGFIILVLVIAWLIIAIKDKKLKNWFKATAACLIAGVLALGANLPNLYHTYEYAKETKRASSELTAPANEVTEDKATSAERPTGGLPKSEIGGWSNTPSETFTLLIPNLKGGASARLVHGQMQHVPVSELPAAAQYDDDPMFAQYADSFPQYFGGKSDSGGTNGPFYVGALICALFILGCFIVKSPIKWALLALTILSALLAMGNHFEMLTDFMIYNVPLYNKFRAAETTLVIAAFAMPLLAVMALQKLFTTPDALKRYRDAIIASFGFTAVLCLVAIFMPTMFGDCLSAQETEMFAKSMAGANSFEIEQLNEFIDEIKDVRLSMIKSDATWSLLFIILGFGVIFYTLKKRATKPNDNMALSMGVVGIAVIVLFDLYSVDKRYVNSDSFVTDTASYTDPLAPDAIDQQISRDTTYYRVADFDNFMGAARSAHHNMVGGYHAAKLNRYNDLIERGAITNPGVLDMLNTRYLISQNQIVPNDQALGAAWFATNLTYVDNADKEFAVLTAIDTVPMLSDSTIVMQPMPSFDARKITVADKRFKDILGESGQQPAPGDTIILTSHSPKTLSYKTRSAHGGVAVFSEVYFPWGWQATIDGKPVEIGRVNYVLRAIRVPAGDHTVVMTFDPPSIRTTTSIAYCSITIIYLLAIIALLINICTTANKKSEDNSTKIGDK